METRGRYPATAVELQRWAREASYARAYDTGHGDGYDAVYSVDAHPLAFALHLDRQSAVDSLQARGDMDPPEYRRGFRDGSQLAIYELAES